MEQVGVGIISFEHFHAISYASAFNRIRECRLVGVADPNSGRGKEMAAANSARYMSVEELLADESISAVCIGSANARHREDVELAAEAGKNVMVEKPMCNTMKDANEMVELADREDRKLYIGYNYRWRPEYQKVKQILDEGSLGRLQYVNCVVKSWRYCLDHHHRTVVTG